ncbi:MAG: hypothetical protein CMK59_13355 [Proteobacteria bacterium]|nr:hypothetical protein [Pseudomonadota bacterium]
MSHNIVVIGPSKVGKTALVASLAHSANVISYAFRDEDVNVRCLPNNNYTRSFFNQSMDIIKYNKITFPGTATIFDYEITLEAPHIEATFVDRIMSLIGIGEPKQCIINFPDAPGGALFPGDNDEYDDAVNNNFRATIVSRLKTTHGLMICLDASYLRPNDKDEYDIKSVALAFTKWLPDVFHEILQEESKTTLNIKRVCFVLTKSDLWAHLNNLGDNAYSSVVNRNAYIHAKDILGAQFFHTIRQYFDEDTEFSFCMSSVFGFHNGRVNNHFLANMDKRIENVEQIDISVNDWKPYNVIEPFIHLLNGDNIDNRIIEKTWHQMGE